MFPTKAVWGGHSHIRRLLDVADTMADWIWEVDSQGRYTYCGSQVERILGYTAEEVLGRTPFDFMPPGEVERVGAIFAELKSSRSPIRNLENWNVARDGCRVCLRTSGKPFFGPEGTFLGYRGFDTDITAVKETEETHLAQLNLLQALIEAIPSPIFYKNAEGVYLGCNGAFARALGRTKEDIVGKTVFELAVPESAEIYHRMDQELLEAGGHQTYETTVRFADGQDHDIFFIKSVFASSKGSIGGLVGVMLDISERKRMEKQLKLAEQEAIAANQAKSSFLANMSHEIRTPFNAILGFTTLLLESGLEGEDRDHARIIHDSSCQLLNLINDILDFSQIEAGQLEPSGKPFDLHGMVHGVGELFGIQAADQGVALEAEIGDDVPDQVRGDELRLRQILVNLVGNALKFTDEGRVTIRVGVARSGPAGPGITFAVEDTGIGFDPAQLPDLLSPFTQGDGSDHRRYGGSGLGLSIASQLVRLLGGTLEATSVPGRGATFFFTLPMLAAMPGSGAVRVGGETCRMENAPDLAGVRVLVAEDSPVNQRLARKLLEGAGCLVDLASNGVEAVVALQRKEYDLVLMDVQMPEMDGLEATREIRTNLGLGDLPILAVTANAMEQDRRRCMKAGMDGFLRKPFIAREFLATVRRMVTGRGLPVG